MSDRMKIALDKAKQTVKEIEPVKCTIHGDNLDHTCGECARYVGEFLAHSYLTSNIEEIERQDNLLNAYLKQKRD